MSNKIHWIGVGWYSDFINGLKTSQGWRLLGKLVIFIFTLLGGIVALASFYSGNLENSLERAEKSYYNFLDNFSSSKRENRMGATYEIPSILSKRVPKDSHVSPWNAVSFLFGASKETVPLYKEKIKKLLFDRIQSFTEDNNDWSRKEVEGLISTLLKIDSSGWYAEYSDNADEAFVRRRDKFNWIWRSGPPNIPATYTLSVIFEGVRLDGISFSNNDFKYPDFERSSLANCDFKYTTVIGGLFHLCKGDSLKVSWAKIIKSDFTAVHLPYSSFYNCLVSDCSFRTSADGDATLSTVLKNSSFQGDSVINVNFENAIMDSTTFVNAAVVNCNFYGCSMVNSDMSNLKVLGNSKFEFSDLRNIKFNNNTIVKTTFKSADLSGSNFSNSNFRSCIFDRADLTKSDFTASDICDTATSWKDANIARVKGLNKDQKRYLLSRGAVDIPGKKDWDEYRKAGAPGMNWTKHNGKND